MINGESAHFASIFYEPRALVGRPSEMSGGKRVNVYLDKASLQRAAEIGDGNVSAGIRKSLSDSAALK